MQQSIEMSTIEQKKVTPNKAKGDREQTKKSTISFCHMACLLSTTTLCMCCF